MLFEGQCGVVTVSLACLRSHSSNDQDPPKCIKIKYTLFVSIMFLAFSRKHTHRAQETLLPIA
jgi:hypothetical protein